MSQENVEIVRDALDAFTRRDWDGVLNDTTLDYEMNLSRGVGPFSGVSGSASPMTSPGLVRSSPGTRSPRCPSSARAPEGGGERPRRDSGVSR